ncbi:hypothetical protein ABIB38_002250 [Massilia sp. UYP11]|jgi:hypothetical protein|uniref:helix-turn-helix transcriptional regulator n=1 Tax=Massilia sp. UYP11 TaxID=1756385 RepID=UPI003D24D09C
MNHEFDVEKLRARRRLDNGHTQGRARAQGQDHSQGKGLGVDPQEREAEAGHAADASPVQNPSETPNVAGMAQRDRYRAKLIAQYKLDSEYIGVSQLARILGISPSAIYGHMRSGRFFLPYRMFNAAPKIFIDDLVEWHCSGRGVVPAFGAKPWRELAGDDQEGDGGEGRALSKAEVDAAVHKAADDAMRSMGIDPSSRRRKQPSR